MQSSYSQPFLLHSQSRESEDRSMATTERLPIEGEPLKPFRLFRIRHDGTIIALVAESDTRDELGRLHKHRLDWNYALYHNGKRIDHIR